MNFNSVLYLARRSRVKVGGMLRSNKRSILTVLYRVRIVIILSIAFRVVMEILGIAWLRV